MFEFLWKWKKAATQEEARQPESNATPSQAVAAGTQLHYDPNLVPNLVSDHHALLGIFGEIAAAMEQKNMPRTKEKLGEFGDALRGHLLKENVRFYVYLQHSLEGDTENAAIMHEFRKEMQHIGKAVADFLHKYTAEGEWDEGMWQSFQQEVGGIGKVLTKRIETEENILYPLYLPQQEYR
ncbi:MAG: hemerythrin domain-containing protein [Pseudomonadota bacterium]|nr:hemerythrin domain-containing protein [Gammaproteobacteria bacterium]MBU1731235.1 hemerythrin domain-containing protein [Gammaproteobacteria bacterium]MBU1892740.1 hemerythrin domain-containing protein [Gammaproteobacteria bacterium]